MGGARPRAEYKTWVMVLYRLSPVRALKGCRNGPSSHGQHLLGDYFRENYAVRTPLTPKRTQGSFLTPNQDSNPSTKRTRRSYLLLGYTLAWLSPHSWKAWGREWLLSIRVHWSLTITSRPDVEGPKSQKAAMIKALAKSVYSHARSDPGGQ